MRAKRGPLAVTYLCAAAVIVGVMALGVSGASADHFEPNSKKECNPQFNSQGQAECLLTIGINDDPGPGITPGETITVDLDPGTTGAAYVSASHDGGTCVPDGSATVVTTPTQLTIEPNNAGDIDNCTILVKEVLSATSSGTICQTLDSQFNAPPETVCDDIPAPPTTVEQCKKGGWQQYGFKNQGDCVAFVATNGKNEPGKNVPNQP